MLRRLGLLVIVCSLVPCFVVAAVAQDEPPAAWDQARVTAYAQELAQACDELDESLSRLPGQLQPAAQRAFYQAKDDVRMMKHSASGMASALAEGKGYEEVRPRFKRVESLRLSAEENGRKALIPDEVFAKITPVGGAIIKLAPYFR